MILDGVSKLAETEKKRLGLENISIKKLGPKYLEEALRRLSPRGQWTVGENSSDLNIYLLDGTLLVTVSNDSRQEMMLKKIQGLTETKKKDRSCATLYTYHVKSTGDLDVMLKKLLPLKPNVYLSRW